MGEVMFGKQRWRCILVVENAHPTILNCLIHIKLQFDNDSFLCNYSGNFIFLILSKVDTFSLLIQFLSLHFTNIDPHDRSVGVEVQTYLEAWLGSGLLSTALTCNFQVMIKGM